MHLSEHAWPDADSVDTDLAVLPVGSTEQHGPHAPLGTDVLTAEAVADAGVAAHDGEVVVAPAIPVGVAEEHRHFAGTLWVSEDTFRAYVRETIESLAAHGWTRVVVVNGHGGNVAPLRELCGRVTRDGTAYAVPFTWFDAVDPEDVEMGHGGPVETSLLQHVHPELVDETQFEDAAESGAESWGEWQSGTNLAYDTAEFSENGTVGDPGEGSPDLGEHLLETAGEKLAALLNTVDEREWEGD
jgi:creatinine amidohydrolase